MRNFSSELQVVAARGSKFSLSLVRLKYLPTVQKATNPFRECFANSLSTLLKICLIDRLIRSNGWIRERVRNQRLAVAGSIDEFANYFLDTNQKQWGNSQSFSPLTKSQIVRKTWNILELLAAPSRGSTRWKVKSPFWCHRFSDVRYALSSARFLFCCATALLWNALLSPLSAAPPCFLFELSSSLLPWTGREQWKNTGKPSKLILKQTQSFWISEEGRVSLLWSSLGWFSLFIRWKSTCRPFWSVQDCLERSLQNIRKRAFPRRICIFVSSGSDSQHSANHQSLREGSVSFWDYLIRIKAKMSTLRRNSLRFDLKLIDSKQQQREMSRYLPCFHWLRDSCDNSFFSRAFS